MNIRKRDQAEYDKRVERHRTGEGRPALYSELIVLAHRLGDHDAAQTWSAELRRAMDALRRNP